MPFHEAKESAGEGERSGGSGVGECEEMVDKGMEGEGGWLGLRCLGNKALYRGLRYSVSRLRLR
jgi:hypothetical protein